MSAKMPLMMSVARGARSAVSTRMGASIRNSAERDATSGTCKPPKLPENNPCNVHAMMCEIDLIPDQ